MKKFSFFLYSFFLLAFTATAQDGALDASFGNAGSNTVQFSIFSSEANGMALQSDGKIILAGIVSGGPGNIGIARFLPSGQLDLTFGVNGSATLPMTASVLINCAKVLSDGSILLGGQLDGKALVAKLTSTGALSSGFGSGGLATFGGPGSINKVMDIDVTANGRIVGGGVGTDANQSPTFCVFRLMSTGGTDANFATGGVASASGLASASTADVFGFKQQSNGRLLVCGTAFSNSTGYDQVVLRFMDSGGMDANWGTGGRVTSNFGTGNNANDQAVDMVVQPDGKVVTVGRYSKAGDNRILLVRYNANGTIDNTFGTNGSTQTALSGTYPRAEGRAIALMADGKFIVSGNSVGTSSSAGEQIVARYTANGQLDPSFGTGGITMTNKGTTTKGECVQVLNSGKVVVGGSLVSTTLGRVFIVSQYNNTGASGSTELKNLVSVSVYPNPVQTSLHIQWQEVLVAARRVQVYDQAQRLILDQTMEGSSNQDYVLPVGGLNDGSYTLRILDKNNRMLAVERFVKQ